MREKNIFSRKCECVKVKCTLRTEKMKRDSDSEREVEKLSCKCSGGKREGGYFFVKKKVRF